MTHLTTKPETNGFKKTIDTLGVRYIIKYKSKNDSHCFIFFIQNPLEKSTIDSVVSNNTGLQIWDFEASYTTFINSMRFNRNILKNLSIKNQNASNSFFIGPKNSEEIKKIDELKNYLSINGKEMNTVVNDMNLSFYKVR